MSNAMQITLNSIGQVQQKEGFIIQIDEAYRQAMTGLDEFSHVLVLWVFNQVPWDGKTLTIPPCYRLLDHDLGIFATRGPFRPNPLALSLCRVLRLDAAAGLLEVDWLDAEAGSPVLDLKPYHPSSDVAADCRLPAWCSHWPKTREASGGFDWAAEFTF